MKKQLTAVALGAVVAVVLTSWTSQTRADEPTKPQSPEAVFKALEAASQPGPEHKRLDPLAGEWTYTSKCWMDPNEPATESSGTIKRDWILGGRFLEEFVAGKGPDGKDFEGRGVVGYDKVQGKYTYGWICSMGTGITMGVGTCDTAGKHFTFKTEGYCPLRKTKIEGRDEIRLESPDRHVFEMYQNLDGKEVKVMELTAERKAGSRSAERETPPLR